LGRNQYVELEIKKPKPNGASAKLPANQKPCDKMTEAVVMDGGKRGQVVKVCADLKRKIHHADKPSPQQLQRDRALERKRIEKDKIAITARHRIFAAVLERVSVPLKKADLLTVARSRHCGPQPASTTGEAPQTGSREIKCTSRGVLAKARLPV
jgi:hypothetical protein